MKTKRTIPERITYEAWQPRFLEKLQTKATARRSLAELVRQGCDPLLLSFLIYNCSTGPSPDRLKELKRRRELLRVIKKAKAELRQIGDTLKAFERLLRGQTEGYASTKQQFSVLSGAMNEYLTLTIRDASVRGELRPVVDAVDLFEYVRVVTNTANERQISDVLEASFEVCGYPFSIDSMGRGYERYIKNFPQQSIENRELIRQIVSVLPHLEVQKKNITFKTRLEKLIRREPDTSKKKKMAPVSSPES